MDPVRELVAARPDFFANRAAALDRAVRLNDFIYMSNGLSNAYMLTTADAGRVIINTGMGFEAPIHKRVFDAVHPGPTPYILLTQGHVDHVGGVRLFREETTWLVAQRQNRACQADDARIRGVRSRQAYIWFKAAFDAAAQAAAAQPAVASQDVPVPDISFDDRLNLRVGELELELHATPGGETVDSCVVWLPQHRILFSGNVFGPLFPHFPNFNTIRGDKYRFVEPYLDSLRRIRSLEPELLITGHFDPIEGRTLIRACLDRLEAAVDFVHRETLARINAGQDIWTAMREVTLPDELYVGQGYGKVSWAVRTIWESYMGWFKAEQTSELYPDVALEAYRDLVGLAGAGAVIARGRERLAAGQLESAMSLAEAALAHAADDPAALELARDANRALLERSQSSNFWETGWLRSEIDKLDRRIRAQRDGKARA
jgi:glyoxylase-like metal-dependent hydrolase (beta-lactamase superfamily II)